MVLPLRTASARAAPRPATFHKLAHGVSPPRAARRRSAGARRRVLSVDGTLTAAGGGSRASGRGFCGPSFAGGDRTEQRNRGQQTHRALRRFPGNKNTIPELELRAGDRAMLISPYLVGRHFDPELKRVLGI